MPKQKIANVNGNRTINGGYEEGKASGIKREARGCRENAKSDDQIPEKQTLESLNPGPLEPYLPSNWEKILKYLKGK